MPKPFTKETKKAYMIEHADIFQGLGYTDGDLRVIINKQAAVKDISDEEYDKNMERWQLIDATYEKLYEEKYGYFKGVEIDDRFTGFVRAMLRPETTVENIRYNEMLAMKLRSKKGCLELIQEAVTLLGKVTPDLVKAAKEDEDVFLQNYNAFMLGSSVNNLIEIMEKNRRTADYPEGIPRQMIEFLEENKEYFESLNYFHCKAKMYANKYHYIVPEKETSDNIDLCCAYIQREDKALLKELPSVREGSKKKDVDYTPAEELCNQYFDHIQKRMDEERRDYVAAAKKADKAACKTEVIPFASALTEVTFKRAGRNEGLVNERTKDVLARAKMNYRRSFRDAAKEMEKILAGESIPRHKNENYQKMLDSIKVIGMLSRKGDIKNLSKEDRQILSGELGKLDAASRKYLETKYGEGEKYSSRALRRIDAARLASAFVRGRMVEVVIAQNKDLKDSVRYYTREDVTAKLLESRHAYTAHKDVKSFAKERAYQWLAAEIVNSGKVTREKANQIVSEQVGVILKVYNKSKDFQKAVATGDLETATSAFQNVAREILKNENREKQAAREKQKGAEKEKRAGSVQVEEGQKEAIRRNLTM